MDQRQVDGLEHAGRDHIGETFLDPDAGSAREGGLPHFVSGAGQKSPACVSNDLRTVYRQGHQIFEPPQRRAAPQRRGNIPDWEELIAVTFEHGCGQIGAAVGTQLFGLLDHGRGNQRLDLLAGGGLVQGPRRMVTPLRSPASDQRTPDKAACAGPCIRSQRAFRMGTQHDIPLVLPRGTQGKGKPVLGDSGDRITAPGQLLLDVGRDLEPPRIGAELLPVIAHEDLFVTDHHRCFPGPGGRERGLDLLAAGHFNGKHA